MEEKIYEILVEVQKDVKDLKKGQARLEERQINLETNQEIMKNNISKILEEQINFNEKFKNHLKEANILYKGVDYRVTLLEA